ncbi:Ig-specific serine endopeptidase MIP [Mesomycoplasma flocculare]|uniref:LppD family lipoprotein n=1 Tax=Mesomycoplasma flocculare ATCC 27399 TaxID=743971 RepID=A0A0A8E927_MESFC|nr:DUF31 family protein [Mesomycoplasma flocculare]AJC50077.1 LppD family lipoprotein [Mesomycoplasma flocculare ATCC 27399]ENX51043.1 hypothetical protein MFC_00358 [Mesomycoplasma flocculare ATCC 27716]
MKKKYFFMKKNPFLLIYALSFASVLLISLSCKTHIKKENSTEQRQQNVDQSQQIKTENIREDLKNRIDSSYQSFENSPSAASYQELKKNFDKFKVDLAKLFKGADLEQKQREWDNAFKTLDYQVKKTNYQVDNLTKLIIGSFREVLKPVEKKQEKETPPRQEIPADKVNQYYEKLKEIIPKGQNWAIVKDGKRIVEDQYQYDFPDHEWRYLIEKFGGGPAKIIGLENPDGLSEYPRGKTKKLPANLKAKIDEQAKQNGQPLYDNAAYRTFVVPKFDSSGKITGIDIPQHQKGDTSPAIHVDKETGQILRGGPGRVGLPRMLPNEEYKKLTKNAIAIHIRNGSFLKFRPDGQEGIPEYLDPKEIVHFSKGWHGTLNILDYKKEDNGTYPLTWYFITNAHVLNRLLLANDYHAGKIYGRDEDAYNSYNRQYNTWSLSLTKIKSSVGLNNIMTTTGETRKDNYYDTVNISIRTKTTNIHNGGKQLDVSANFATQDDKLNNNQELPKDAELNAKTIVFGTNVFEKKPGDYTDQEKYKNMEELLDFAIMELTFDNEQQAKVITQDWYNDHKDTKTNDKTSTITSEANLLEKNQYEQLPANQFYGLGFPVSEGELNSTLNEYKNKQAWQTRKFSVSPYVNKDHDLYFNSDLTNPKLKDGGDLSWTRSYRSFVNKPGLTDLFISNAYVSNGFIKVTKFDKSTNTFKETPYLFWGLGTLLDNFTAGGGMSGTGVYKNNKLYSLVFANDRTASTALTLNLRSYGHEYNGYYGSYNLPKYDLIYGSKHQRKSYFQAMQQLYTGKSIKTYLFPNGFDDAHKVDVFGDWK